MGNGLGPSKPTFENFAELITSDQVPAATTVVDRTNPILGQGELPQEPAQIDKALRDVGNFPERPDSVVTRRVVGSDQVEAVGLDAEGNTLGRVFRGDPSEAQRIAQRANQGIQRVVGQDGGGSAAVPDPQVGPVESVEGGPTPPPDSVSTPGPIESVPADQRPAIDFTDRLRRGSQGANQRQGASSADLLEGVPASLGSPISTLNLIREQGIEGAAAIAGGAGAKVGETLGTLLNEAARFQAGLLSEQTEFGGKVLEGLIRGATGSNVEIPATPAPPPRESGGGGGARAQPQSGGGGQTQAQPQEEREQPEPQESLERLAPQGATAQDVAELIDPSSRTRVEGGPNIPRESVATQAQRSSRPGAPSEEQLQQAQAQAPENFGRLSGAQELAGRIQGGVERVGEELQKPEVRRGLAQLAQLFVRPDSGIGQVAQRQEQAATQELKAEQVQALVEGRDVEAASPEVVRQAEEIKQSKRRTEQQERRLDLRKKELQLQRQQQLFELAQAMQERQKGEELKGFEIDAINQQAIGEFLPRVLQQVSQSKGLQIISQLQAAENPSPEIIRSQLSEDQQKKFDQFRNRLQKAVRSGDQGALFGVVQGGEEGGGEGGGGGGEEQQTETGTEQETQTSDNQTSFTIQSGSPQELANAKQNAAPGDTIEVNQEIQIGNKTLPPGLYRVQDDEQRSLDPIAQ